MHHQMDSLRKELPELVLEPLHHHHRDFFIQPNSWTGVIWTTLSFIKHRILKVSVFLNVEL
jgi:hypothetical protein